MCKILNKAGIYLSLRSWRRRESNYIPAIKHISITRCLDISEDRYISQWFDVRISARIVSLSPCEDLDIVWRALNMYVRISTYLQTSTWTCVDLCRSLWSRNLEPMRIFTGIISRQKSTGISKSMFQTDLEARRILRSLNVQETRNPQGTRRI